MGSLDTAVYTCTNTFGLKNMIRQLKKKTTCGIDINLFKSFKSLDSHLIKLP